MQLKIVSLPGFLGLSKDWDFLKSDIIKSFDLNHCEFDHFYSWADQFNSSIKNQFVNPILMGYSFGGRLALHALIRNPHLWRAGIIISGHPGLADPEERSARLKNDREWADRFLSEDWEDLMKAWNSREIFQSGSFAFQRKEEDYNREELAAHLRNGSLGLQADLREEIGKLSFPILWLVGENDKKFVSISRSVKFKNSLSEVVIVPNVGHRLPWENAPEFSRIVEKFMNELPRD